ncbi:MAG: S4 domain-containing protein [Thermoanaerobaculia bacterium]
MRLDKWLQIPRVFKTRTKATRACNLNRVRVNGQAAKPHRRLALGDLIELEFGDWIRRLVVRELRDRPLPKAKASRLYDDLSPPRPVRDPFERLLRRAAARREKGAGRPTKRQRRQLERWKSG